MTLDATDAVTQFQLGEGAVSWLRSGEQRIIEVLIQFNQFTGSTFDPRLATAVVTIPQVEDVTLASNARIFLHDFSAFDNHIAALNLITVASTTVGRPTAAYNTLELHTFNMSTSHTNPVFLRAWERIK